MQDTFEMLEELLEQEQFELLFPKENGAQAEWECYETYENNEGKQGEKDSLARVGKRKFQGDIRLVYLMNDAVESFSFSGMPDLQALIWRIMRPSEIILKSGRG